ncbi:hypothetical protein AB0I22_32790 [Streptomyces sp. NPDC050610]|uniref:hypothetical protein n=1 Tax=Streptomyces sp. NPDC050610 TaxID=3157097 RepID=UPI00343F2EE3
MRTAQFLVSRGAEKQRNGEPRRIGESGGGKRRSRMAAVAVATVITAAAGAVPATAATGTASPQAPAATHAPTLAAKHASVRCGSKKVNFSWSTGTLRTTVYANNHCGHKKVVAVKGGGALGPWSACWPVKKGKSHATFRTPPGGGPIKKIVKGSGC